MKNAKNPPEVKSLASKRSERAAEHEYAMQTEPAFSSAKRGIEDLSPTSTPEKKPKDAPEESACDVLKKDILAAINQLGQRLNDRMDDISSQIQQHSTMLASVAKVTQLNSEDIEGCKTKIKSLEQQVGSLLKEKGDLKERLVEQERYKRRWCLRIKGKKEEVNENIRADTVNLLCKVAPDLADKMEDAVDIVHRVGRKMENSHRQVIVLFSKRNIRDDIWKRTKVSAACREAGVRFAEDLTKDDLLARQEMWPKIEQARKEGKTAGFRGPYGYINGKRIEVTPKGAG